jgi:hypothetical protein
MGIAFWPLISGLRGFQIRNVQILDQVVHSSPFHVLRISLLSWKQHHILYLQIAVARSNPFGPGPFFGSDLIYSPMHYEATIRVLAAELSDPCSLRYLDDTR